MGEHLVVAFDGSPVSRAALHYALETHPSDEVTALYVVPSEEHEAESERAAGGTKLTRTPGFLRGPEDETELGEVVTETAGELAAERGYSVDTRLETGSPPEVVAEVGAEPDVDHVVVGAPMEDGPGPVAQRVVSDCPATVTLVRG